MCYMWLWLPLYQGSVVEFLLPPQCVHHQQARLCQVDVPSVSSARLSTRWHHWRSLTWISREETLWSISCSLLSTSSVEIGYLTVTINYIREYTWHMIRKGYALTLILNVSVYRIYVFSLNIFSRDPARQDIIPLKCKRRFESKQNFKTLIKCQKSKFLRR